MSAPLPAVPSDSSAPAFTCPHCGRVSHNPTDIAQRYCGACHRFLEVEITGALKRHIAAQVPTTPHLDEGAILAFVSGATTPEQLATTPEQLATAEEHLDTCEACLDVVVAAARATAAGFRAHEEAR